MINNNEDTPKCFLLSFDPDISDVFPEVVESSAPVESRVWSPVRAAWTQTCRVSFVSVLTAYRNRILMERLLVQIPSFIHSFIPSFYYLLSFFSTLLLPSFHLHRPSSLSSCSSFLPSFLPLRLNSILLKCRYLIKKSSNRVFISHCFFFKFLFPNQTCVYTVFLMCLKATMAAAATQSVRAPLWMNMSVSLH